jgi:LysM repeat protein
MRKTASFLSTLVVFLTLGLSNVSAQVYTYIQYDGANMDRLDHQFLGTNSGALYTSYRITKNASEKVFLDIGIESPRIYKKEMPGMVSWQKANLDRDFISGINSGRRKVYICKKLDSGWAVQPIGSAIYVSNNDNILTYISSNYDLQADFKQTLGNNLSINARNLSNPSNVFYVGELPACNRAAQQFKVYPSETAKYETTITIMPELGLIRENPENCPVYELVAVNGKDVCSYLGGGSAPAEIVAQAEPTPEVQSQPIPETYEVIKPYVPIETSNGEVYVNSKTVVEYSNVTKSDDFGESVSDVPASYSQQEKPKPAKIECNITAAEGEHVIQGGENLYSIARRYGLGVNSLRAWNNLNTDKLYPCTTLKIVGPVVPKVEKPSMEVARTNDVPTTYNTVVKVTSKKVEAPVVVTKTIECEVEYTDGEHVVLQGDNLYSIARKYNVTLGQLKSWNKIPADNKIRPCQKLVIAEPKATVVNAKAVPAEYKTVVKPKLVAKAPVKVVAKKATVTSKSVTKIIPASYVKTGAGLHVVVKGETVLGLAKRFEMTEAEFRKINFLTATEGVSIGQVIRSKDCSCTIAVEDDHSLTLKPVPVSNEIPGGYNYVGSKSVKTAEGVVAKGTDKKFHVVQASETLYSIAKNYGKSVDEIRKLNNMEDNEVIVPNQLLVLEKAK